MSVIRNDKNKKGNPNTFDAIILTGKLNKNRWNIDILNCLKPIV